MPSSNAPPGMTDPAFQKHFRVNDLARLWSLSRETVRKIVAQDPGPGILRIRNGPKKSHTILVVSEAAAKRIYTRLINPS